MDIGEYPAEVMEDEFGPIRQASVAVMGIGPLVGRVGGTLYCVGEVLCFSLHALSRSKQV
jgi:hypothetical protein